MIKGMDALLRGACGLAIDRLVVAGVSGGPDSLCLLDVLQRAGYPLVVAHFNHRLRPEAEAEQEAVSGLARRLGLPFVTESGEVKAYSESQGLSVEEAARTLRYRFLFAAARKHTAQAVAVGHTADDQAETVLMHFLRGAGLAGLKGMEYRSFLQVFAADIPLVRPLLRFWRSDTEAYCREHGLSPHMDASNLDPAYFRNRLRHSLLPELERYQPRFKQALVNTALALQGDYAILQEILDEAWQEAFLERGPGWIAFDRERLSARSAGLRRNLIRRAAESLRPERRDIGFEALQRTALLFDSPPANPVDFINGLYLFSEAERIYLAAYEADLPSAQWPQVKGELTLPFPGELDIGNGWQLSCRELPAGEIPADARQNADPYQAWLDLGRQPENSSGGVDRLAVRAAKSGERLRPLGMDGHSLKFSDFYVNVKLPRRARAGWPVVFAGDTPVWVPGFCVAHPFRITEGTERAAYLLLKKG